MYKFALPYPPTINHYYGQARNGRRYIKPKGLTFRTEVKHVVKRVKPLTGPLSMTVEWWPPDRRRRDGDNILKALQDALQHAGVYKDDCQIVELHIFKRAVMRDGMCRVEIKGVKK